MTLTGSDVADEELKKKIALYYHTLVIPSLFLTIYIVPGKSELVVCAAVAEKLYEAHEEAVHRLEHENIEVAHIGL
jgi:hypothetical protein